MGAAPPPTDITESIIVDAPVIQPVVQPPTTAEPTVEELLQHIAALDARLRRLEAAPAAGTPIPPPTAKRRTARRIVAKPNWHGDLLKELAERRKKIKGD